MNTSKYSNLSVFDQVQQFKSILVNIATVRDFEEAKNCRAFKEQLQQQLVMLNFYSAVFGNILFSRDRQ